MGHIDGRPSIRRRRYLPSLVSRRNGRGLFRKADHKEKQHWSFEGFRGGWNAREIDPSYEVEEQVKPHTIITLADVMDKSVMAALIPTTPSTAIPVSSPDTTPWMTDSTPEIDPVTYYKAVHFASPLKMPSPEKLFSPPKHPFNQIEFSSFPGVNPLLQGRLTPSRSTTPANISKPTLGVGSVRSISTSFAGADVPSLSPGTAIRERLSAIPPFQQSLLSRATGPMYQSTLLPVMRDSNRQISDFTTSPFEHGPSAHSAMRRYSVPSLAAGGVALLGDETLANDASRQRLREVPRGIGGRFANSSPIPSLEQYVQPVSTPLGIPRSQSTTTVFSPTKPTASHEGLPVTMTPNYYKMSPSHALDSRPALLPSASMRTIGSSPLPEGRTLPSTSPSRVIPSPLAVGERGCPSPLIGGRLMPASVFSDRVSSFSYSNIYSYSPLSNVADVNRTTSAIKLAHTDDHMSSGSTCKYGSIPSTVVPNPFSMSPSPPAPPLLESMTVDSPFLRRSPLLALAGLKTDFKSSDSPSRPTKLADSSSTASHQYSFPNADSSSLLKSETSPLLFPMPSPVSSNRGQLLPLLSSASEGPTSASQAVSSNSQMIVTLPPERTLEASEDVNLPYGFASFMAAAVVPADAGARVSEGFSSAPESLIRSKGDLFQMRKSMRHEAYSKLKLFNIKHVSTSVQSTHDFEREDRFREAAKVSESLKATPIDRKSSAAFGMDGGDWEFSFVFKMDVRNLLRKNEDHPRFDGSNLAGTLHQERPVPIVEDGWQEDRINPEKFMSTVHQCLPNQFPLVALGTANQQMRIASEQLAHTAEISGEENDSLWMAVSKHARDMWSKNAESIAYEDVQSLTMSYAATPLNSLAEAHNYGDHDSMGINRHAGVIESSLDENKGGDSLAFDVLNSGKRSIGMTAGPTTQSPDPEVAQNDSITQDDYSIRVVSPEIEEGVGSESLNEAPATVITTTTTSSKSKEQRKISWSPQASVAEFGSTFELIDTDHQDLGPPDDYYGTTAEGTIAETGDSTERREMSEEIMFTAFEQDQNDVSQTRTKSSVPQRLRTDTKVGSKVETGKPKKKSNLSKFSHTVKHMFRSPSPRKKETMDGVEKEYAEVAKNPTSPHDTGPFPKGPLLSPVKAPGTSRTTGPYNDLEPSLSESWSPPSPGEPTGREVWSPSLRASDESASSARYKDQSSPPGERSIEGTNKKKKSPSQSVFGQTLFDYKDEDRSAVGAFLLTRELSNDDTMMEAVPEVIIMSRQSATHETGPMSIREEDTNPLSKSRDGVYSLENFEGHPASHMMLIGPTADEEVAWSISANTARTRSDAPRLDRDAFDSGRTSKATSTSHGPLGFMETDALVRTSPSTLLATPESEPQQRLVIAMEPKVRNSDILSEKKVAEEVLEGEAEPSSVSEVSMKNLETKSDVITFEDADKASSLYHTRNSTPSFKDEWPLLTSPSGLVSFAKHTMPGATTSSSGDVRTSTTMISGETKVGLMNNSSSGDSWFHLRQNSITTFCPKGAIQPLGVIVPSEDEWESDANEFITPKPLKVKPQYLDELSSSESTP